MKSLSILIAMLVMSSVALSQAQPTAVAPLPYSGLNFGFPSGTFQYGANISEIFQTGYLQNGDVSRQTNLSGDVAYSSKS